MSYYLFTITLRVRAIGSHPGFSPLTHYGTCLYKMLRGEGLCSICAYLVKQDIYFRPTLTNATKNGFASALILFFWKSVNTRVQMHIWEETPLNALLLTSE